MRLHCLMITIAAVSFSGALRAQDAYFMNESTPVPDRTLLRGSVSAPQTLVIAGTKKGKCTPEMPMLDQNVEIEVQLQATADKTFVLDADDLDLHLKALPGQVTSKVIKLKSGNYDFTCGDEALPVKKRTNGMFMVM